MMSNAPLPKAQSARATNREIPLREAIEVFSDPARMRHWQEAKARPVYYVGPQRSWATGEIHQVQRRDPAAEAAQIAAWAALVSDLRARLCDGELEATGIPHPSADGRRTSIPAKLWSVLQIDRRWVLVWDGIGKTPAPGDQVWRDVRVRRHQTRVVPNNRRAGPIAGVAELDEHNGNTHARRTATGRCQLEACIRSRLDQGDRPGDTMDWKTFCDRIRDESDGWTLDAKSSRRKTQRRGYSNRTIERFVKLLRGR